MRSAIVLCLSIALAMPLVACKAPTKHTGKRPVATRRVAGTDSGKTMQERLLERDERLRAASEEGRAVPADQQLIGVGSTRRFHLPDCTELENVPRADRVLFVSTFDGLDGGYHPCDVCKPRP